MRPTMYMYFAGRFVCFLLAMVICNRHTEAIGLHNGFFLPAGFQHRIISRILFVMLSGFNWFVVIVGGTRHKILSELVFSALAFRYIRTLF